LRASVSAIAAQAGCLAHSDRRKRGKKNKKKGEGKRKKRTWFSSDLYPENSRPVPNMKKGAAVKKEKERGGKQGGRKQK